MTKFFFSIASAALLAAGCAPSVPPSPTPAASSLSDEKTTMQETPSPATSATTSTTALPTIDATWNTYTNNALKFSFKWPTRGRYAPTWNVTFVKEKDAQTQGCASTLRVGELAFCHVASETRAGSQLQFTDTYDTTFKSTNVRFTFKKITTESPAFDPVAYRAHLDQIVRTFQLE